MVDKPGCTTARPARRAAARRRPRPAASSRSATPSTTCRRRPSPPRGWSPRARIGRVVQTIGLGPHRIGLPPPGPTGSGTPRAAGDILVDIASHQFEQFLHFTGSTAARILSSVEAQLRPSRPPRLERLRPRAGASDHATGFIRVDWLTADGLAGLGRRPAVPDRHGRQHRAPQVHRHRGPARGRSLFLTDGKGTRHIDCTGTELDYGAQLRDDVLNRTETAMPQAHCFLAMELALEAHASRRRSPAAGRGARHDAAQGRRRRRRGSAPRTSRPTGRCRSSTRSRRSATSTPAAAAPSREKFAHPGDRRPARATCSPATSTSSTSAPRRGLHQSRRRSPRSRPASTSSREAGRQQPRRGRRRSPPPRPRPAGASAPIFQYRFGHGIQKLAPPPRQGLRRQPVGRHRRDPLVARDRLLRAGRWRGTFDGELGGCLTTHAIHIHDILCEVLGPARLGPRPHLATG